MPSVSQNRRYAILVSVVIAAVITPTPDIITCLIVSGPMYLLFEFSVLVVRITERRMIRRKAREQARKRQMPSHNKLPCPQCPSKEQDCGMTTSTLLVVKV